MKPPQDEGIHPEAAASAVPHRLPAPRHIAWVPIALEAFLVVLGVVLALAANEWRQRAADERRATAALATILEELNANREELATSAAYHRMVGDSLRALWMRKTDAVPSVQLFSKGYVHPGTLLFTAWQAANATGAASHLPYDKVLQLERMYELQRRYEVQSVQMGQLIYAKLFEEGAEALLRDYDNLNHLINMLLYRECSLLAQYEGLGAHFEGVTAAPVPEDCISRAR